MILGYDIDEMFSFWKKSGGYGVCGYLKSFEPKITKLEYPSEYNGEPVTSIAEIDIEGAEYIKHIVIPPSVRVIEDDAFWGFSALESVEFSEGLESIGDRAFRDTRLKSIVFPKSLKELGDEAFWGCERLESITFNSDHSEIDYFGRDVFWGCFKLPPEIIAMSVVRSTDITRPIFFEDFEPELPAECFRPDVFELLLKNDSFRNFSLHTVLSGMIDNNKPELLPAAEEHGMLENAELVDSLLDYSAENQRVEITAYLLELKKRKFGFNGGNDFEL